MQRYPSLYSAKVNIASTHEFKSTLNKLLIYTKASAINQQSHFLLKAAVGILVFHKSSTPCYMPCAQHFRSIAIKCLLFCLQN